MGPRVSGRNRDREDAGIPGWSWAVAAAGLALVLGSAGFMLYQQFTADTSPPEIAIATESIGPRGSSFLVEILITNRGGSAAAGLVVEGVLKEGSPLGETSSITLDYVPARSERRAGLFFTKDPQKFDLQLRAVGYRDP